MEEYYDYNEVEDEVDDEIEDLPKNEFVNSVEEYYSSILKYKDDHKKELDIYWRNDYDNIQKEFENILNIANYNWIEAKKSLEKMECYKYSNFSQYVYHHDMRNTKLIKGTDIRPVTLRRKRSNLCPKCKIECKPTKEMDTMKCPKCGYEIMKNKAGIPDNVINGEKHIRKHYDKLIGSAKIPATLTKLLPWLTIWLTDWKYIREWLKYSDRFDAFVNHYMTRSGKTLHYEDFDIVLERSSKNKMDFEIYEIFTEEFYKMTELMSKINKKTSNVIGKEDFIMELMNAFMGDNLFYSFKDIPEESTTFEYNGTEYSIGIYLNKLSLIYDYDKFHIKNKIVERWCVNGKDCIIFPGNMFNFNELFTTSQNIPKSFIYSENYNKVMFEVFHSKFTTISNSDIRILIDLHLRFNEFYKHFIRL